MEIKINTIIKLSNNQKYMVLNETIYEDNKYYLVMGMTNDEVDTKNVSIIKEVIDNNETYIEEVKDTTLVIRLIDILKNQTLKES